MTIIELLKTPHHNLRVSYGDTWLYWDGESAEWIVRQHKSYARQGAVMYRGDEDKAVSVFVRVAGIETKDGVK